jgi:septal ring factor EnvC (AmiA/AmiB activator)
MADRNGPPTRCIRIVVAASIVAVCASLLAQPADRTKTEALARQASERLQTLQREADQLASDERTLLNELRALELQRQIKAEELHRVSEDARAAASDLAAINERITALEQEKTAERPDVSARLVEIYKLGRARYLRLLLTTSDVRQLGRASRLVGALAQSDRLQLAAHQRTIESLRAARGELEARTQRTQSLKAAAERAQATVAASAQSRSELVREIDQRRDLNAQFASELQTAQQKLQVTLRDLASGAPLSESVALPLRPFRGTLAWPVDGPTRRRFDQSGSRAGQSAGIEIAAGEGTPVRVIHDGLVAFSGPFSGFGNLVIVDHGTQTFSLYGDLLDTAVKQGARLEGGQLVGTVGKSPAGPAGLYFELRIDGKPVDPLQWLKKRS